jgi:putative DNA primase/helicase
MDYTTQLPPPEPYQRHIPDSWDIPAALTGIPRWLVWQANPRGNGKVDKIPVSPITGHTCNATDPASLTSFEVAQEYASIDKEIAGLGFSLFLEDRIIGGDLDHCIDEDGRFSTLAEELLVSIDTYWEISPSGRGLRFLGMGLLDRACINSEAGLELYGEKRFVTVTGNAIPDTAFALENIQEEIDHLVTRFGRQSETQILALPAQPVVAQRIHSALERIHPDCSYDDWITVGMALKSTHHEKAFDWFNNWSAWGDKYPGAAACRRKWQSFATQGRITLGTLYWLAGRRQSFSMGTDYNEALDLILKGLLKFSTHRRLNTDVGNVERFIDITEGNARYVPGLNQWIAWQGRRWEAIPNAFEIARFVACSIHLEKGQVDDDEQRGKVIKWGMKSQEKSRMDAMVDLARQSKDILLPDGMLDASGHLLGVANGTIDLNTGELLSPERDRYITKSTSVSYDPEAPCPRWEQFINEIMDGDVGLAAFLQRLAGYALWGGNPEQVVTILHGTGSNGKSTFVSTLQQVLGDYARQIDPTSLMAHKYGSAGAPRDDLVRLYRARLAVSVESGESDTLDEGLIKMVSGGDVIYARGVYAKRGIEFVPEFLLMLATNHKPVIRGTDYAIWRRLILVLFERAFKEQERDRHLAETLAHELPGILRWMVAGCIAWRAQGLDAPAKVRLATQEYRSEMDILGDWIEACCVVDPGVTTPMADLYRSYSDWCESEGSRAFSNRRFGRNLGNKGYQNTKQTGQRCRVGLRLM